MTEVTVWFDCVCPFAWATSRWVEMLGDSVQVQWKPMSLYVLNESRRAELPEDYGEALDASYPVAKVFGEVAHRWPQRVGELYTAVGSRIHREAMEPGEALAAGLAELGLPTDLGGDDDFLRASHAEALELVGDDVGTPVVAVGSVGFFGPVITRVPGSVEEARSLFDAVVTLAQYPHFFELKRTRTEDPRA